MLIVSPEKLGTWVQIPPSPLKDERLINQGKAKNKNREFVVYLMWFPLIEGSKKLSWDTEKLMEGVVFCMAHPLYHPEKIKDKQIYSKIS